MFKHKYKPAPQARDRLFWVVMRANLSDQWRNWLHAVQPATVVAWHRQGFRLFWRWKSRRRGRPVIPKELREAIRQIAMDNPDYGAPRIHAELLLLGFDVDERTVSRYLAKLQRQKPRRSGEPWKRFLLAEADAIAAMDFVVPTATFRLTYGFSSCTAKRGASCIPTPPAILPNSG
jgi:hypothetical protein